MCSVQAPIQSQPLRRAVSTQTQQHHTLHSSETIFGTNGREAADGGRRPANRFIQSISGNSCVFRLFRLAEERTHTLGQPIKFAFNVFEKQTEIRLNALRVFRRLKNVAQLNEMQSGQLLAPKTSSTRIIIAWLCRADRSTFALFRLAALNMYVWFLPVVYLPINRNVDTLCAGRQPTMSVFTHARTPRLLFSLWCVAVFARQCLPSLFVFGNDH